MAFTGTWTLPAFTNDGVLDDGGNHGYVADNTLPAFTLTGNFSLAFNSFTADNTLPLPELSGAFLGSGAFTGSFELPLFIASGTLKNGNVYAGSWQLPLFDLSGQLGNPGFSGSWQLPLFAMDGRFGGVVTATFRGWPVNLKTFALTEFDNFNFNSFCRLNGEYLAASDDGIFALSGATDAGTKIDARVRLALSDLGIAQTKRPEEVFISYRSGGTLILSVVIDGGQTFEYPLEPTGKTGMYQARVKVGKGIKANYLCFEITNFDGADFDLDQIRVRPAVLSRSIG